MELHEEIQKLHVLATAPEFYEIFVKFNSVSTCLGLLNHENTGIYACRERACPNGGVLNLLNIASDESRTIFYVV